VTTGASVTTGTSVATGVGLAQAASTNAVTNKKLNKTNNRRFISFLLLV
jgi:hypothetical protein